MFRVAPTRRSQMMLVYIEKPTKMMAITTRKIISIIEKQSKWSILCILVIFNNVDINREKNQQVAIPKATLCLLTIGWGLKQNFTARNRSADNKIHEVTDAKSKVTVPIASILKSKSICRLA